MSRFSEILEWLRPTFSCASRPTYLEQEQAYIRTKADIEKRREARIAKAQKSNSKIIPTSDVKRQAPLPPINTVNNKRQAPRPPINVFAEDYKKAAENQTSKADQTASTLLR